MIDIDNTDLAYPFTIGVLQIMNEISFSPFILQMLKPLDYWLCRRSTLKTIFYQPW